MSMLYEPSSRAVFRLADLVRSAGRHDSPAFRASTGSHVNDKVGVADDIKVMFNDNDGCPVIDKALEYIQERHHV